MSHLTSLLLSYHFLANETDRLQRGLFQCARTVGIRHVLQQLCDQFGPFIAWQINRRHRSNDLRALGNQAAEGTTYLSSGGTSACNRGREGMKNLWVMGCADGWGREGGGND